MPQAGSRVGPGLWGGVFVFLSAGGALCCLLVTLNRAQFSSYRFGLCAGLDVFCGLALATGALWLAFAAEITGIHSWKSAQTASSCIGVAAYAVALLGGLADPGLQGKAWPAAVQFWSQSSVVSGAVWTLGILGTIFLLQFLPNMIGTPSYNRWIGLARHVRLLLIAAAALIATTHQIGLTRLMAPTSRSWSLWSGPGVGIELFVSSFCAALAVLLFASWRSIVAFHKRLPLAISSGVARLLTISVFLYLAVRSTHLLERGLQDMSLSRDSGLLLLELGLFYAGMIVVSGGETNPKRLYHGSAMIMAGVVANRLNISITALERNAARVYRPGWIEVIIAYSLVAVGVVIFAICVKRLPVFVDTTEGT